MAMISHSYETASPSVLCYDSFVHLNRAIYKWENKQLQMGQQLPVHVQSLLWPPHCKMVCLMKQS